MSPADLAVAVANASGDFTVMCPVCGRPFTRKASELRVRLRRRPHFAPTCSDHCAKSLLRKPGTPTIKSKPRPKARPHTRQTVRVVATEPLTPQPPIHLWRHGRPMRPTDDAERLVFNLYIVAERDCQANAPDDDTGEWPDDRRHAWELANAQSSVLREAFIGLREIKERVS